MKIVLDLPDVTGEDPEELAQRIRLYSAVLMVHGREISAGAACEFAGVDRYALMEEAKRHGLTLIDYSPAELAEELEEEASHS